MTFVPDPFEFSLTPLNSPADPDLHAVDFSHRYFEPMDYHVGNRMTELGIPTAQIGSSVPVRGIQHACFIPHETTGGGNGPGGRLVVDSGVFNPDLHADLGPEVSCYWARAAYAAAWMRSLPTSTLRPTARAILRR